MEKFTRLDAIACPLGLENVDTDQLIPARFMSRPRSAGYGGFLLHDLREDDQGFILDEPRYAGAKILVARRNFGTGSSREAAVYALWDFGIRAVIAPSFGDIFASNACKNGLLTATVTPEAAEALIAGLETAESPALNVDLEACTIAGAGQGSAGQGVPIPFTIDPVRRMQLLNGWDDLDLTRQYTSDITAYRTRREAGAGWAFPRKRPG
jgi:3-isopropylmalate/(R)-2-methylmalate dehydratase small subunit